MGGQFEYLNGARNVPFTPAVHFGNEGVANILRVENFHGRFRQIPLIYFRHRHNPQQLVLRITQGNILIQRHPSLWLYGQSDRQRKNVAIGQAHLSQHMLIIRLPHKTIQRRKSTNSQ
jgi:hypothetical protein